MQKISHFLRPAVLPLFIFLVLPICAVPALAEDNLIVNGDFSEWFDGGPSGWTSEMFDSSEDEPLSNDKTGYEGSCVMLQSEKPTMIRLYQTVPTEPDTLYHFSAYMKTEDLRTDGAGATLSAGEAKYQLVDGNDTSGEWIYINYYAKTGPDQTEMEVSVSLGEMDNPSSGKAWFDQVQVVQLKEIPEDCPFIMNIEPDQPKAEPLSRHTEAFLLLVGLLVLVLIAFVRKYDRIACTRSESGSRIIYLLFIIPVAFAFLYLRCLLLCKARGDALTAPNIAELCHWHQWQLPAAGEIIIPAVFLLAVCYYVFKKRNIGNLCLIGSCFWLLLSLFGPVSPAYFLLFPLLLLVVFYVRQKDWRVLAVWIALCAACFIHLILMMEGGTGVHELLVSQLLERRVYWSLTIVTALIVPALTAITVDICVFHHLHVIPHPAPEEQPYAARLLAEPMDAKLRLKAVDYLLIAIVTALYAVIAFINLGSLEGPQTGWTFNQAQEGVIFDLGQTKSFHLTYYHGITDTGFFVEFSEDGQNWTKPELALCGQGSLFQWLWFVPTGYDQQPLLAENYDFKDDSLHAAYASEEETDPFQTARYVRLTALDQDLMMFEVGFLDEEGKVLPIRDVSHFGGEDTKDNSWMQLVDEQDIVPEHPTYLNSFYFDEIYHARTAYEHLHGLPAYEWTHPPLGKVLMMIGIRIFGMTGFGWRFMGALVGVLMLPLLYLLVHQLTKSTLLSMIAMSLFSLDLMHFSLTRIATVDSYAVFWILLMYLFMLRYCQMSWNRQPFRRTLIPLGLCGITMGLGWATKWICIYASAGLAILFFWALYCRLREAAVLGNQKETWKRTWITIGFCIIFFVIIPVVIYYFSYYWLLRGEGLNSFSEMFTKGSVQRVIELQKHILDYHTGLNDTHFYQSPWYQWPIIWWPILFYSGTRYLPEGTVSVISCMGNPAVWWFGLAALLWLTIRVCWSRRASRKYVFVVIGFASQYLPWVFVPRATFIYHYFASVPFIIIASVLVLDAVRERSVTAFRITAGLLILSALILFVLFYPMVSGLPVSLSYARHLQWFHWFLV